MDKQDDGGPAFPQPGDDWNPHQAGLTIRDWFAGQALASTASLWFTDEHMSWEDLAVYAYGQADAMLQARKDSR